MKKVKEWFGEWFDSPYYHILYKHRDFTDARTFIDNLNRHFKFKYDERILDLACGKGRHSIYLNDMGLDVTGLDLSIQNITHAKEFENERLKFGVHDMREEFAFCEFDYVLNLFTSFGYFDSDEEHFMAFDSVYKSLKPGGIFVIDFLNSSKVIQNLIPMEKKEIDGINFDISKWVSDENFIIKDIAFQNNGHLYSFQEKVKALRYEDFVVLFEKTGFEIINVFGDYNLNTYKEESSDRVILVGKK
jgi:SAM-dependent methyltransferase